MRRTTASAAADSLAPPRAEPYTFGVCSEVLEEIVLVSDDAMREAMRKLFLDMKLAVEPAGAATTAALCGPLKDRLKGLRVGIITCGANIGVQDHCELLTAAPA